MLNLKSLFLQLKSEGLLDPFWAAIHYFSITGQF